MKIYVAGPYSTGDPVINTRNAIYAAEELIKKGHIPYVPHLTLLWHIVAPHDLEFWYEYDQVWLRFCNAVFRLEGESTGAANECKVARSIGLPIYLKLEDVPDAPK